MLIEAIDQPIRYRFRDGREIVLALGTPVEVPDQHAQQLLLKVPTKVRRVETRSTRPQLVRWEGADGSTRSGSVDCFHTEADGTRWAFVTMPDGGWAAVNLKYLTLVGTGARPERGASCRRDARSPEH